MTGQTILHYEIRERIGQGGMGVVYAARDLKLNRLVALKFLSSGSIASPGALERLRKEAEVISSLNHPHIETIHDLHEVDGKLFLVLEYLPGGTLKKKILEMDRTGWKFSMAEALRYAIEAAEGLAHAHRRGIVHCDVKTSNLLLTAEGALKITDFGLARLGECSARVEDGMLLGTVPYMSPEQGRGLEIDARTDIFSFGVVLFELVTGSLPFQDPQETALHPGFANTPAPSLRQFRGDAPDALVGIVARALQKRPEDRYQRMDDLVDDLQALRESLKKQSEADTEPLQLPAPAPQPRPAWMTRLSGAGVAALLLLALVMFNPSVRQRLHLVRTHASSVAGHRLAVLPFRNIGGAASDATCAGMMEVLTNKLTQLEQFRGSVRMFSASDVIKQGITSPAEARRAFGATMALAVSVHREREKLVLNLNLVDTRTQLELGAGAVEAMPEQLSGLEESLVAAAARMLKVQLRPEERRELVAGMTPAPGAYEFYLQGRGYLQEYSKLESIDNAITVFEQALKLDDRYAAAYAGLGRARLLKYDKTKEGQWVDAAEQDCGRAASLDSQLPEAHICLGTLYNDRGQYERAAIEFQRAQQAEPTNDDACRGLALAEERLGKVQEAENTYRRAIELRPDYWAGYNGLGRFFYQHARYQEAAGQFEHAVALTPDNNQGYYNLGAAYLDMDRYDEAVAAFRKSIQLRPTYPAYANLGTAYMNMRRFAEAAAMYEEALKLGKQDHRVYGYLAKAYYWAPGKRGFAKDAFERALELGRQQLQINPRDTDALALMAEYSAMLGRRSEALGYLKRVLNPPPEDPEILAYAAVVHNQFGEREQALAWLNKAVARGYPPRELAAFVELDNLRQDPRFPSHRN